VLAARQFLLMRRDARNLRILLAQVPVLALLVVGLYSSHVFEPGPGRAREAAQLLFLMVITVAWIGAIDGARELVKERAVFVRERAIGVSPASYLVAKLIPLCSLAAVQTFILAGVVFAIAQLHEAASTYAVVVAVLLGSSFVAVTAGLLVSSFARSEDQASSLIPVVLITQLMLGGALKPVHTMSPPLAALSALAPVRSSFAGVGAALHLNRRAAGSGGFMGFYGTSFFAISPAVALLVLGGFAAVFVAVCGWRLKNTSA
jgi:ABC-type multidrug transport system permease subunit